MNDLFARARRTDPPTSHEAADKAASFAPSHCGRIMACLDRYHPYAATYEQISNATGLERHACARRLPELERAGRIVRVGEGKLANGNSATAWRVA